LFLSKLRTKTSRAFGTPEESITARKKEHLRNVAARYLETYDCQQPEWRIDFVAVEMDRFGKIKRLEVIKNAVKASSSVASISGNLILVISIFSLLFVFVILVFVF